MDVPKAPDTYDEISTAEEQTAITTGTRIMEFAAEDGDTFTVFERLRGGYVGRHIDAIDETETFYELKPEKVAEEFPWPGEGREEAAELATSPLMAAGWEITYFDEENAGMRMQDLFRDA